MSGVVVPTDSGRQELVEVAVAGAVASQVVLATATDWHKLAVPIDCRLQSNFALGAVVVVVVVAELVVDIDAVVVDKLAAVDGAELVVVVAAAERCKRPIESAVAPDAAAFAAAVVLHMRQIELALASAAPPAQVGLDKDALHAQLQGYGSSI